jgi:hypothetical protein
MPFRKGDPNINRRGRPKKGTAIADEIRDILESGAIVDPKTGQVKIRKVKNPSVRRLFAESLIVRSFTSNSAARLLMHYVEGLPVQTVQNLGDGKTISIRLTGDISDEDTVDEEGHDNKN